MIVVPPALTLEKTVGTVEGVCATTTEIDVAPGTTVYYCYKVTNDSTVTYQRHDLEDDQLGTILADFLLDLAPGNETELIVATVIMTNTVNTATWTASTLEDEETVAPTQPKVAAMGQAQARVNILQPMPTAGWPWLALLAVLLTLCGGLLLRRHRQIGGDPSLR